MTADIFRALLKDAVNHGITLLAFWLIQRGWFTEGTANSVNLNLLAIGISTGLVSLAVSIWRKARLHNWIFLISHSAARTPIAEINAEFEALPVLTILPAAK